MSSFKSNTAGIDLAENTYLTETELVDRFVGNRLWMWGFNNLGNLGDGTRTARSSPVQTIAGGTNWITSSSSVAGIKSDGTLWLWGAGAEGQIGDNTRTHRSSPVQTVSGGTNWKDVSSGFSHTLALKTDGTLWNWGYNAYGNLGDNTRTHRSSPIQTIAGGTNWKAISAGYDHNAAIKTDGTLWTWGDAGGSGRLGDGTRIKRSSPIQTIAGGTNWSIVACGAYHTAAIKTDGTLWLWGGNGYAALGDGTTAGKSSPIQTIAGGTNWKDVSGGGYFTAATKTDGTLWTWGHNLNGQLGDGTIIFRSSPVQVITGGNNWKQVSCAGAHMGAIKNDGTLWMWGSNANGQIGDNTRTHRSSPVQTVMGGSNWKKVINLSTGGLTAAITFAES